MENKKVIKRAMTCEKKIGYYDTGGRRWPSSAKGLTYCDLNSRSAAGRCGIADKTQLEKLALICIHFSDWDALPIDEKEGIRTAIESAKKADAVLWYSGGDRHYIDFGVWYPRKVERGIQENDGFFVVELPGILDLMDKPMTLAEAVALTPYGALMEYVDAIAPVSLCCTTELVEFVAQRLRGEMKEKRWRERVDGCLKFHGEDDIDKMLKKFDKLPLEELQKEVVDFLRRFFFVAGVGWERERARVHHDDYHYRFYHYLSRSSVESEAKFSEQLIRALGDPAVSVPPPAAKAFNNWPDISAKLRDLFDRAFREALPEPEGELSRLVLERIGMSGLPEPLCSEVRGRAGKMLTESAQRNLEVVEDAIAEPKRLVKEIDEFIALFDSRHPGTVTGGDRGVDDAERRVRDFLDNCRRLDRALSDIPHRLRRGAVA